MPCFSPLNIKNPTVSYRSGYDPIRVNVPCGKCAACRKKMQDDWCVRIYAEWLECVKNGGVCAMATLTYNNAHVPIFRDDNFCEMVFSHADITSFLKKLRVYLKRRYGITNLRYIIFPEYGSKSTRRPHYHILIFFPIALADYQIRALIRKAWINGFVGFSSFQKGGTIVNSPSAIIYCAKYATKDLNFYGKLNIANYIKSIKGDKQKKEIFSQHVPRHYQSKGFGKAYLIQFLQSDKLENALLHGIRFKGTERVFALPNYLFRSTCYITNTFGVRVISEEGAKILSLRNKVNISRRANKMAHDFTTIGLASLITCSGISTLTKGRFNNYMDLSAYILNLMDGRSYLDLLVYQQVYQNRAYYNNPLFIFNIEPKEMHIDELTGCGLKFKWFQLNYKNNLRVRQVPEDEKGLLCRFPSPTFDFEKEHLFNSLWQFRNFDEILDLYSKIVSYQKEINLTIQNHNNNKAKELADKFYYSLTPF